MINIIRGDWRFFWPENIGSFAHLPSAWDSILNTGLGIPSSATLWLTSYLYSTALLTKLGISWGIISIIFWILPPVIFSFLSAYFLSRYLFRQNKIFNFLSGLLYIFNTYFLLIFTGGQLGVCFAYALAPFVILRFCKSIHEPTVRNGLLTGVFLGLQILFDPRLVYITLTAVLIYYFLVGIRLKQIKRQIILTFFMPFSIVLFLHSYWILPLLLTHFSSIPKNYIQSPSISFFSFADFSHAFSLLHPNWPENLFGKVYFLRPEFLVLPILAYSSILFLQNSRPKADQPLAEKLKNQKLENKEINLNHRDSFLVYFVLLGILGTFLAKGVNEPFGNLYLWMFDHVPGFIMFRDPTKFYLLISLSYALLIPFSLSMIARLVSMKYKILSIKKTYFLILISFIILIFFLLRPVFSPMFTAKFLPKPIPDDYIKLKNILVADQTFSRTLWIPQIQRYGFFSNIHPAMGRAEFSPSATPAAMATSLQKSQMQQLLQEAGVKYIIVPYDSEGEIFLKDRRYDARQYKQIVKTLQKISWLSQVNGFHQMTVFQLPSFHNHFYLLSENKVSSKFINATKYDVSLSNIKSRDKLIFSEGYDPNWVAIVGNQTIHSKKYHTYFNSFNMPKNGNYTMTIYYQPQTFVMIGLMISAVTLIILIAAMWLIK